MRDKTNQSEEFLTDRELTNIKVRYAALGIWFISVVIGIMFKDAQLTQLSIIICICISVEALIKVASAYIYSRISTKTKS